MNNYGSRTHDTTNALGNPARDGYSQEFQRYSTQAQEGPGNDSMSRLQGIASDVVNSQQGAAESEHIVGVMLQDESGQSIQRRIKVGGSSEQEAVARARTHYTNHGYRVLDAWYMSQYPAQESGMTQAPQRPQSGQQPQQIQQGQPEPVREIGPNSRNRYVNRALNTTRTTREETREMFADQQEEFSTFRLYMQLENEAGAVISRIFKTRAADEEEAIDNAEVYYDNRGFRVLGAEVDEQP